VSRSATNDDAPKIRPKVRRALRALGGRRVVVEGFGRRAPTFIAIAGGNEAPRSAWLSPSELRRLVEVARRILK
jgi:hypothetical protein